MQYYIQEKIRLVKEDLRERLKKHPQISSLWCLATGFGIVFISFLSTGAIGITTSAGMGSEEKR
jgi:uncharacterized membrane protein